MSKGLLFTYLLTYGGSAISFFNPFYGLLVYFCFAVCNPQAMWWFSVPLGNYSRIVALSLLAGWALSGFGNWHFGRAKPIILCLIGYWLWSFAGLAVAEEPWRIWVFGEAFAKILLPIVVGITLIDSVKRLKQIAWVLTISQAYVAYEFNMWYWDGFNYLLKVGSFAGLDNNSVCIAMVTAAGMAFFLGLRATVTWQKLICFGAAGLLAHVTMFGDSRGGMLALVVTGIMTFFILPKGRKPYLAFALAVVVGLRLAGPAVTARFVSIFADEEKRDASAQSRLDMWEDCWDVMIKNPLIGIGADQWPLIAPEYGWARGKEAHSLWFQTGAEMGFVGVGFLAGYYGLAVAYLWKMLRKSQYHDPFLGDAARMVIAALTGFGVAASFVSLEGLELPYYVGLLGAGTIKVAGLEADKQRAAQRREQRYHAPAALPHATA